MSDSFVDMLAALEYSRTHDKPNESKLERNARHIAELQQVVSRMLELLHDLHEGPDLIIDLRDNG